MRLHLKRDIQIVAVCTVAIILTYVLALRTSPPKCYTSDLQNDYLSALAFRDGLDIYTPLTELSARYFPVATTNFPHPSPHPPVMMLLALPLSLIPFEMLVPAWLALNIALVLVIGRRLGLSLLASVALVAWPPLLYLLDIGQWELVVLLLAMLAWQSARDGRDWRAGALFGLAALVKLYPALLVLPFLFRSRLKVVTSAVLVFLGAQLFSALAIGVHDFARYWTEVFPAGSGYYTGLALNGSPYGALLRVFGGAQDASPIWQVPGLVVAITVPLSLLALASTRWLRPEAAAVALLVMMPNVWGWYPVLALPQVVFLWKQPHLRAGVFVATTMASTSLQLLLSFPSLRSFLETAGASSQPAIAVIGTMQAIGCLGLLGISIASSTLASTRPATARLGS